jgi:DNA polymerase III gamma/tau subunit
MKRKDQENEGEENIALYRKYRPEHFRDVIGQDHIVKAISGALEAGKVAHAYLLSGPRGTGKTTIARIIATSLGTSVNDIYEMDAASNRGIDDVREIRESVRTIPFDSKYKIYILDEVHMFTKDAWNALLKTIEEPPKHVIFILATTELEKVPETIISRCQTFTFKKPTDAILAEVVTRVAKQEGYTLEEGGASLIALLAGGAFRDALGTLQKVLSFSKEKKISMDVYIKMILAKLRYALMLRYAPSEAKSIENLVSEHDMVYIRNLISAKPEHISSSTLSILLEAYQSLRTSVIAELPLELALVRILNGKNQ